MLFVGIHNSPEKLRLLETGRSDEGEASAADLAFDCVRHREFLERVVAGPGDEGRFRKSLYWRYLVSKGRPPEAADERCRRFLALYRALAEDDAPPLDPVAVTDDGIRLDGSHRAAIAAFLGVEAVPVGRFRWEDVFAPARVRHIREEAELKREGQLRWLGHEVRERGSGDALGRVRFVDAELRGGGFLRRRRTVRLFVAVDGPDASLRYVPEDEVVVA